MAILNHGHKRKFKITLFLEKAFFVNNFEEGLYGIHTERLQSATIRSGKPPQRGDNFLFVNTRYSEGGGLLAILDCDVGQDGSVTPYQDRILYPVNPEKMNQVRNSLRGNVPAKLIPDQLAVS